VAGDGLIRSYVMLLEVHQLREEEVHKDMVRIPEVHRRDIRGERVKESSICRITVDGSQSTLVSVRGLQGESRPWIRMDEKTRLDLGITEQKECDFQLEAVGWWGQFMWAWGASDPTPRIAARMGLLSLGLGALGFVTGITSSCG